MKRLMLPVVMLFAVAALLATIFARQTEMPQWYLDTGLSTTDTDMDGIPDAWERNMRSDPVVADSDLDRDGDGLTDLEEFKLGSNPCMFSTADDFWSDKEKRDMGFAPSVRVEPTVSLAQWQAYLGWTREQWLAWAPPDQHGFGMPYAKFIYNTPPYSDTNGDNTVDCWLRTRTDRPALAMVRDRFATNNFIVLPGERRYRLRMVKDGSLSLTLDPLPDSLAKLPGATNGIWLCEMSLESAQSNLVVFFAGNPPHIPNPPPDLECLIIGDEPQDEPLADSAPQSRPGIVPDGGEMASSLHSLADGIIHAGRRRPYQRRVMAAEAACSKGTTAANQQDNPVDWSWTFQRDGEACGLLFEDTNLTASVKAVIRDEVCLSYSFVDSSNIFTRLYPSYDPRYGGFTGVDGIKGTHGCVKELCWWDYKMHDGSKYFHIKRELSDKYLQKIALTNRHEAAIGTLPLFLHAFNSTTTNNMVPADYLPLWWSLKRESPPSPPFLMWRKDADTKPESDVVSFFSQFCDREIIVTSILNFFDANTPTGDGLWCKTMFRRRENGYYEPGLLLVYREGKWRVTLPEL